jgi:hypothetical protein
MEKEKGRGMPYFEKDHWQKKLQDIELGGERYASQLNTEEEYRKSVDGLSGYLKKNRMKN